MISPDTRSIIERELQSMMTPQQLNAVDRIMHAEAGELCSIPMSRRSGKTRLSIALMNLLPTAIVVVPTRNHAVEYDRAGVDMERVKIGNADLRGYNPDLVVFDEVQDMMYMEHERQRMRESRFLNLYTPHGGQYQQAIFPDFEASMSTEGTSYNEEPVTRARVEEIYNRARREARERQLNQARSDIQDLLGDEDIRSFINFMSANEEKQEEKEWNDEENDC